MKNINLGYIENDDRLCTMLRLLRVDAHKTLREVGALVGLSAASLSNIERGASRLTTELLMKLLAVYGVRLKLEDES